MKRILLKFCALALLTIAPPALAVVSPIVGDYGEVFPTLTEQDITVYRTSGSPPDGSPPWYVTFNLLTTANVSLGAQQLSACSGAFDLTSIYLVTSDGTPIAFGTDTFTNPFSNPIKLLVTASPLPPGQYALAFSGSGDAFCGANQYPDVTVRIQVTPSANPPQPAPVTVSPIVGNYGEVFPILTEQSITVYRTSGASPWFVTFNLLTTADVKLGAQQLSACSGAFDLTSIRLVKGDGTHVAFGTDTFTNPFPSSIVHLVTANALPAGQYALAFSGSGDAFCGANQYPDVTVRIQVTPSANPPQPAPVTVSPIVGNYGEVFPILTEQSITVYRTSGSPPDGSPPWFVTFNLLTTADVKLGAQQLSACSGAFDLTSIRLVRGDGTHVAFGTDTFTNPFPSSIVHLVTANALPAGQYALAFSGSGDAFCGANQYPDVTVRIQVTPSRIQPQPAPVTILQTQIVGNFGPVAPTLTEQSITVSRTNSPPPWFVTFNLLTRADVKLGAQELSACSGALDLTSIRLVRSDGTHLAFGTDTFATNPFPSSINQLVTASAIPPGEYILAFSGSGDAFCGANQYPDATVRIQVTPPSPTQIISPDNAAPTIVTTLPVTCPAGGTVMIGGSGESAALSNFAGDAFIGLAYSISRDSLATDNTNVVQSSALAVFNGDANRDFLNVQRVDSCTPGVVYTYRLTAYRTTPQTNSTSFVWNGRLTASVPLSLPGTGFTVGTTPVISSSNATPTIVVTLPVTCPTGGTVIIGGSGESAAVSNFPGTAFIGLAYSISRDSLATDNTNVVQSSALAVFNGDANRDFLNVQRVDNCTPGMTSTYRLTVYGTTPQTGPASFVWNGRLTASVPLSLPGSGFSLGTIPIGSADNATPTIVATLPVICPASGSLMVSGSGESAAVSNLAGLTFIGIAYSIARDSMATDNTNVVQSSALAQFNGDANRDFLNVQRVDTCTPGITSTYRLTAYRTTNSTNTTSFVWDGRLTASSL